MRRPEDLREDIQRVRGDLAETVDALVAKTELKRRAEEKAHDVKDRAVHKAQEIKERAAEKAHEVKEAAAEKAHEVKEVAAEKAHEVKQRADSKAHEVKERVETKAHAVKDRRTHVAEDKIESWGGRVDAVRHHADRPSGSHPLGQVTALARRKPVQAGALGLLIGALIALITRRRTR
jgi:membrane protein involved in colicin uptake